MDTVLISGEPVAKPGYSSAVASWGRKLYELSNHLGNVLATITDKKVLVSDGGSVGGTGGVCANGGLVEVLDVYNRDGALSSYRARQEINFYSAFESGSSDEWEGYIDAGATLCDNNGGSGTGSSMPAGAYYVADLVSGTDYAPFGMGLVGRTYNSGSYKYGYNGQERDQDIGDDSYDYGMRISDQRLGRFLSVDPLAKSYPQLTPYQFASNQPIESVDQDGMERMDYKLLQIKNGKAQLQLQSTGPKTWNNGGFWGFFSKEWTIPLHVRVEYNGQHYVFASGGSSNAVTQLPAGSGYGVTREAVHYAADLNKFKANPSEFAKTHQSEEQADQAMDAVIFKLQLTEYVLENMAAAAEKVPGGNHHLDDIESQNQPVLPIVRNPSVRLNETEDNSVVYNAVQNGALPGSSGAYMGGSRLSDIHMLDLTKTHGVEFAQVYTPGSGKNGGGGFYTLYSGTRNSVNVPLGPNSFLINHTHPGGTRAPSVFDTKYLERTEQAGSPQRSSVILPVNSTPLRFNKNTQANGGN